MKFTDGFWRKRDGVAALHPAQVYDLVEGAASLTAYATTRKVERREHTLDAPLITISCESPMPDVIKVRISHLLGERPKHPNFAVASDPETSARVETTDSAATLVSGALGARFLLGDTWRLEFVAGDRVLTSSGHKGIGVIDTDDGQQYVHEQLGLGVGETVYGLGGCFGRLGRDGRAVGGGHEV